MDDSHEHDHDSDHGDEHLDPRILKGWEALDAGDVVTARQAAEDLLADVGGAGPGREDFASTRPAAGRAGTKTEGKGKAEPTTSPEPSRMDALLLLAACAREEGDADAALENLERAAKEDPAWCTPELWIAELLSEDPKQLDEALRHARRALDRAEEEDEYLDALRCKAAIELDLGRLAEARKTLAGLPPSDAPLEDPSATLDFAQLLIDAGDPAEARVRLLALTAAEPELADAWYLLGVAADLLNDEDAKRAAWIETRRLDLQDDGDPEDDATDAGGDAAATSGAGRARFTEDALIAVAEETLAEMPEELRSHMRNVPIVVAEVPAAADVAAGLDPRLLGLFSGTPHADSAGVLDPPSLTEIVLFRRNIEGVARDEGSLREEVRTTLLHEAGHFFGLDEAALTRLGLD